MNFEDATQETIGDGDEAKLRRKRFIDWCKEAADAKGNDDRQLQELKIAIESSNIYELFSAGESGPAFKVSISNIFKAKYDAMDKVGTADFVKESLAEANDKLRPIKAETGVTQVKKAGAGFFCKASLSDRPGLNSLVATYCKQAGGIQFGLAELLKLHLANVPKFKDSKSVQYSHDNPFLDFFIQDLDEVCDGGKEVDPGYVSVSAFFYGDNCWDITKDARYFSDHVRNIRIRKNLITKVVEEIFNPDMILACAYRTRIGGSGLTLERYVPDNEGEYVREYFEYIRPLFKDGGKLRELFERSGLDDSLLDGPNLSNAPAALKH